MPRIATGGRPRSSAGTSSSSGAVMNPQASDSSSAAPFMTSRKLRTTSCARSAPNSANPANTSGPSGYSASSSAVTTPKLPPPPRSAHSSSAFSSVLARTIRPSHVTSSAPTRLSQVRPCLRSSQPDPPPSVSPATPVVETRPPVVARPCTWVARSTSAQMAPPPTRATRRSASTSMSAMPRTSSTTPSSHRERPATEWPPARTATGRPWSRANASAATTSSTATHSATRCGRRSIIVLNSVQVSS
jgi:hypothetical protein